MLCRNKYRNSLGIFLHERCLINTHNALIIFEVLIFTPGLRDDFT